MKSSSLATISLLIVTLVSAAGVHAQSTGSGQPTCSDTLDIAVHGQHVIGDYVTGIGHEELGWPPDGGEIGQIVAENGGVAIAGGPGPGFHFPNGVAPGASFCTDSQSPGAHF